MSMSDVNPLRTLAEIEAETQGLLDEILVPVEAQP
jgi:hypothetical protein